MVQPKSAARTAEPRGPTQAVSKYIGHDNNRDFFASTQPETENINRVLYHEWFPQVLYNHHQTGPAGTVVYSPPLRDPFNYNQDPNRASACVAVVAGGEVILVDTGPGSWRQVALNKLPTQNLLIHDVLAKDVMTFASNNLERAGDKRRAKLTHDILSYHASPAEAAEIAATARVETLVFTHMVPPINPPVTEQMFARRI